MIVTIVAKTRQRGGACVGGITADGRSVRLIAPDAAFNEHHNLEYEVGQRWEIDADPPREIIPPHVENVIVRHKRRLAPAGDLVGLIEEHMPPRVGGPEALYEGLLRVGAHGALYVGRDGIPPGIPPYSTTFWRPDRPLRRDTSGKRLHYRYPTDDGGRSLTFVGFQEPPAEIPAGTLVRVSLAHWWRPEEWLEEELRCYVQLSGWIEDAPLPGRSPSLGEGGVEDPLPNPLPQGEGTRSPSLWEGLGEGSVEDPLPNPLPGGEGTRNPLPGGGGTRDPLPGGEGTVAVLKRVFGYDEFRPLQAEIIANVLAKRDSLAVMPTGSGKSLCYQLPALISSGLTVVVSPLISLMEDQVMQLRELGAPAAYLNSTLAYDEYVSISHRVAAGKVKLLYTAPETLLRPETLALLDGCRVDCLTIDEAHCISEWGHDFRPEYRQLAAVRRRFPGAVCLAVTATATERVRADIRDSLGIADAAVFISSFDRENLFLDVAARVDGLGQTLTFLENHRDQSGIIYCMTRKTVDALTQQLAAHGWNALPYHAGLDTATRTAHQRRFTYDEAPIIVATVAFGMGINKSNVRFVLHYDLPKDLESYYQQIGRAGRDGLRADCLLLFSAQDVFTINFLIDQGDAAQRPGAMARLQAMLGYAESDQCRRRPLLAYFGETVARETCGQCDNCTADSAEHVDLTVAAQKFLSCVRRTGEIFGAGHVIDVLRGSRAAAVLSRGHERLSTYNIGGEYSRKEWQQLARQFIQKGLLNQDMEHGSLKLTARGWEVLRGEAFHGAPPVADRVSRPTAAPSDYDADLFAQLRALRLELAVEAGVPPYVIFHDSALGEMATYYPQSAEALGQMQGVGAVKLERYGDACLRVIRAYCQERGIAEKPKIETEFLRRNSVSKAAKTRPPANGKTRRDEVVDLYQQGRGVNEIAEIFSVQPKTVINNLWEAAQEGVTIAPEPLLADCALSAEAQARVLAEFERLGADTLRPIYDALGETVEWDQLHLLRLYFVLKALANGGWQRDETVHRLFTLGESGDPAHVPELVAALNHENGNVRRIAASALGKLRDQRAVEPLMALLSAEEKPQVRQYAVKALGAIGDPRAWTLLESIAGDEREMDYTRKAALGALEKARAART
jgi:ATP-dependent DNA helicase RecQ